MIAAENSAFYYRGNGRAGKGKENHNITQHVNQLLCLKKNHKKRGEKKNFIKIILKKSLPFFVVVVVVDDGRDIERAADVTCCTVKHCS